MSKTTNFTLAGIFRMTLGILLLIGTVLPASATDSTEIANNAEAAESVRHEATEAPEAVTKAEMKKRRAVHEPQQREDYLRNIPPFALDNLGDTDAVRMHTAREWSLLTYPTGQMPSMPWNRARSWVRENVQDSGPWRGPGIALAPRGPQGAGLDSRALVVPSENIWTAVGPQPLDSIGTTNNAWTYGGSVGGRVGAGALASDPSNPAVAYAGFAAGGLWKTTNLGSANVTWTPLWDDKDFVTQAVGAIEIDPNDSNTLYVGTGDWPAQDQFSAGIMKSTDAGATWTQLGANIFTPYAPALPAGGNRWSNQNMKTIEVDPKNSNTVLVGTRYDLYLSNDAGATWQICGFGNGYTNPDPSIGGVQALNRVSGIYLDDRGAQTVAYVSVGYQFNNGNGNNGVYRFTVPASGCPSWPSDFTTLFGGLPAATGNGVNSASGGAITGRVELAGAIGSDNQLTLYAQVSDSDNYTAEGTYVLRPDGGSTTWTKLSGSTSGSYVECDGSSSGTQQGWYDLFLAVNPANDKEIYIGQVDGFKGTVNSSYSSVTLTNITNVYSSSCPEHGTIHPDQQAFAWVEGSGGTAFLMGNDGGLYYNGSSGNPISWESLNDGFNVHQFYAGQIGADFAGGGMNGVQWLFGGMQDNGNASWDSTTSDETWTARGVGGDGFFTTFDPVGGSLSSGWWITEYAYGDMYCSDSGAQGPYGAGNGPFLNTCGPNYSGSPDWSTPFMIDTLHCDASSGCSNYLLGGDFAYAATRYKRGAPQWSQISGSLVKTTSGSIITINMAPSEPKAGVVGTSDGKVWWSEDIYSGSSCSAAAANTNSFSCSPNTGAAWQDIDAANATLPNRAVLGVAFDPANHDTVYAAVGGFDTNTPTTPGHLFQATWNGSSFNVVDKTGNLPDVPASSVAVNPNNRKQVFVGTYFGFYYTDDIDAASVNWIRYQTGLPNTVIRHLTIDRGPAASPLAGTTLAAFTYGRGVFVLKLPTTTGNTPPTAAFTESCTDLACNFTDGSTDSDGTIASWSWTFGDGGTSSAQNPSYSYGSAGTYTVSLTVTDDGGATDTTSHPVTVTSPGGSITLSANGYKVQGRHNIDLTWSGATGANVDVYRDGSILTTTANDGAYTDSTNNRGGRTYVYQVCEAGTSTCSNSVSVVF